MSNRNNHTLAEAIHNDFLLSNQLAYEPSKLEATNVQIEKESADYGALDFQLNGKLCKFRVGKVTPKKVGFFVKIWKRPGNSPIMPYDLVDPIDFFIFSVHSEKCFGQFIFPKKILAEKRVLSIDGKGGKRAMRVYPPSIITTSKQAQDTQAWQQDYFLEISFEDFNFLPYL